MRRVCIGLTVIAALAGCRDDSTVPNAPSLDVGINAPLVITTTSLPHGNVGTDYANYVEATGGQGSPLEFRVAAGRLPNGLQMSKFFGVQSTLISGRPTTVQTTTFTVEVRDKAGHRATKVLSITIDPAQTLVITTPGPNLAPATVGKSYFANLFANGGTTPYTWSIVTGQLPPGLRLQASPGRINGTPTARGTFTFTLRVRDQGGQQASQQYSITVS